MKQKGVRNREQIVQSASELFYHQGFNHTSFSEIAAAAGVPRGNFYYYFKTKDEILRAVIEYRNDSFRQMLAQWQQEIVEPHERLKRIVKMMADNSDNLVRYGCPLGTLNMELGKTQAELQGNAVEMFNIFLQWMETQLVELGYANEARQLAEHMMSRIQGVSMFANLYKKSDFIAHEARLLGQWIDSL